MKYYVAADGGGTKLLVVLYDETFRILRSVRTAGTNSRFKPVEQVRREVEEMADALFAGEIGEQVREIESLDMSIVGSSEMICEILEKHCAVRACHDYDEGNAALGAAGVLYGCVAQAGTGSDAFLIRPDQTLVVGGLGALLGDEGSGYDIGLRTLKAAIYSNDGRGPKTLLEPMLLEQWKLNSMWELVMRLIQEPDSRRIVASASYLTEESANRGDEVACEIYRHAGREMALQVNTALARSGAELIGPVVASGGAWKGSRIMFDTFREEVWAKHPGLSVMYPVFEPVVGCVILRALSEGMSFEAIRGTLETEFAEFRYRHP